MAYQIWNRRYTGSKYKLAEWISNLITENCSGNSFCDIFAGTAVMSKQMLEYVDEIYIIKSFETLLVVYMSFIILENNVIASLLSRLLIVRNFIIKLVVSETISTTDYISIYRTNILEKF